MILLVIEMLSDYLEHRSDKLKSSLYPVLYVCINWICPFAKSVSGIYDSIGISNLSQIRTSLKKLNPYNKVTLQEFRKHKVQSSLCLIWAFRFLWISIIRMRPSVRYYPTLKYQALYVSMSKNVHHEKLLMWADKSPIISDSYISTVPEIRFPPVECPHHLQNWTMPKIGRRLSVKQ